MEFIFSLNQRSPQYNGRDVNYNIPVPYRIHVHDTHKGRGIFGYSAQTESSLSNPSPNTMYMSKKRKGMGEWVQKCTEVSARTGRLLSVCAVGKSKCK